MEIHLLKGSQDLEFVKNIAQEMFEYKELSEFIDDYEICKNKQITSTEKIWYKFYETFNNSEYKNCEYCVRLTFNKSTLYAFKKKLIDISQIIESLYTDAICVFSPDNIGIIDVYIKTDNIGDIKTIIQSLKNSKKKSKKKDEKDDKELFLFLNDENKEYIFIRDLVVPSLLYIQLSGVENIKKCYFQKDSNNNWIITTKGSNLKEVVKHPLIDYSKLTTNHLWDVYEVFGIQAARNFLKIEFQKLLPISMRHLDLLIHAMTYSGKPQAVTRYGIDRKQVGALAKVAFEQPFDNFFHSATNAEKEDMKGNSSAITVGRVPAMGSGYTTLIDQITKKIIDHNK
jgi:DNA-directed RNA polymerase beta' subunit